jgi:hypothetical protein
MTGPRFIDVSRPGIAGGGSALVNLSDVHTAVRTWDKEDGVHSNGPPEPVFVEEVGDDAVVLEMPSSGRCVWGDYTYDTLAEAKSAFRERRLEDRANADQTAPASTPSFADGGWAPPSPVEP